MKILSIETSCDDTAISIIEVHPAIGGAKKDDFINPSFKILANNINSQIKIHIPYGGVFPALAKREHERNLPIILEEVLKCSKSNFEQIKLITVTCGPGLEMSLWTGIVFAKELARKWKIPLIPVNHMEGHVFSVFGKKKGEFKIPKIKMPALSLLVSGGHTQLILVKKWMQYEIIGESVDDAVGEAFDKVARMLELPYPGGPEISKLAEEGRAKEKQDFRGVSQADEPRGSAVRARTDSDPEKIGFSCALPRPMLYSKNLNFSFSGLKTAVLYLIRDLKQKNPNILQDEKIKQAIALEFENAAIECLVHKTQKALEKYKIKTLIVAGGVSANKYLQSEMTKIIKGQKIKLYFPAKELTGDNSIMIGMAGYLNYIKNKKKILKTDSIKATGNLRL